MKINIVAKVNLGRKTNYKKIANRLISALPLKLKKNLPENISLVFVSQKESAYLNKLYKAKDMPANVLSFKYSPDYGEIIISCAKVRKDAQIYGNPFVYQVSWMILHGIIHLADLHHENSDKDSQKVFQLEKNILENFA